MSKSGTDADAVRDSPLAASILRTKWCPIGSFRLGLPPAGRSFWLPGQPPPLPREDWFNPIGARVAPASIGENDQVIPFYGMAGGKPNHVLNRRGRIARRQHPNKEKKPS